MNEKNVNECLYCGCYDEDFGCTMPSIDKWYACPLERNEEELREMFNMSNELIRKSDVIEIMENLIYDMSEVSTIPQLAKQSIENLPPVNAVELPCKVGDKVYIIERDENGRAFEVTAYMFLAKANEAVICTSFINNLDNVDDILECHIEKTAEDWDTDLSVFPITDCFLTREEAEKALEDLKNE